MRKAGTMNKLQHNLVFIFALFALLIATDGATQESTISRKFSPVIFKAGAFAFVGQPIDSLVMYRFETGGAWTRIPFQIDEVSDGGSYLRENDGIADANDELLFMPGDAGAKADPAAPFGPGEAYRLRWEIEVSEPANPAEKGWVYLFKKAGGEGSVDGYLSYAPDSQGAGADTVFGESYAEGHGQTGWLDFLSIQQNGTFGPDLVDRQKLRVKGTARAGILTVPYEANEEASILFDSVKVVVGPIRAFRTLFVTLDPLGTVLLQFPSSLQFQYFPYSTSASARNAAISDSIADIAGIQIVRQSIDFSENAVGMQFYSDSNAGGVQIDGVSDQIDASLPVSPDVAFLAVNGSQGMVTNIVEVPAIGDSQAVYYRDDATTPGTNDGTKETGDNLSYGDMGILLLGSKLSGQFSFDFASYYLGSQADPVATADRLRFETRNPLAVSVELQEKNATAVEAITAVPDDFTLLNAKPNPFAPALSALSISFTANRAVNAVNLTVYNILGQEVARLARRRSFAAGTHSIQWDGRSFSGARLPAGLYFYAIESAASRQVKKILLVR